MRAIDAQCAGRLRIEAALDEGCVFKRERPARHTPTLEHLRNRGAADRISLRNRSVRLQCGRRVYPGRIVEIG